MEGDITATDGNADTKVAFENCAPLRRYVTIMPMYNLTEYSDNYYADSSGSLYQSLSVCHLLDTNQGFLKH